jgi:hypothetical protein
MDWTCSISEKKKYEIFVGNQCERIIFRDMGADLRILK